MIFDKIENSLLYSEISADINIALNYISSTDLEVIKLGKHIIDGDNIFALVNEYDTKNDSEGFLEGHRSYLDVQYMIEGEEKIGVTTLKNQNVAKKYNAKDDYVLYDERYDTITLKKGMFVIFFPDDLHKPGIEIHQSAKVKKVVVKVKNPYP